MEWARTTFCFSPPFCVCLCVCLQDQIPQVVEKAAVSEGDTPEAQRRAAACGRALDLHLSRLRYAVPAQPAACPPCRALH